MKNLKLTDKELVLIINALTDRISYKSVQKLLVNMQNQLEVQKLQQEIGELCEGENKSSEDWDKFNKEVGKRIKQIKEYEKEQEQEQLVYVKEKSGHIFQTEKELIDWLRGRGIEGTDEYIVNESVQIGEVKQIKRSELTDTE